MQNKRQRTSVSFPETAGKVLDDLAKETERTKGEVLRHAIALEKYVQDTWKEGGRVIIERGGEKREILPS